MLSGSAIFMELLCHVASPMVIQLPDRLEASKLGTQKEGADIFFNLILNVVSSRTRPDLIPQKAVVFMMNFDKR